MVTVSATQMKSQGVKMNSLATTTRMQQMLPHVSILKASATYAMAMAGSKRKTPMAMASVMQMKQRVAPILRLATSMQLRRFLTMTSVTS